MRQKAGEEPGNEAMPQVHVYTDTTISAGAGFSTPTSTGTCDITDMSLIHFTRSSCQQLNYIFRSLHVTISNYWDYQQFEYSQSVSHHNEYNVYSMELPGWETSEVMWNAKHGLVYKHHKGEDLGSVQTPQRGRIVEVNMDQSQSQQPRQTQMNWNLS